MWAERFLWMGATLPAVVSVGPTVSETEASARVDVLIIDTTFGGQALHDDLAVRLPSVSLLRASRPPDATDQTGLTVFLRIGDDGEAIAIELITSDGRAFDRTVQPTPDWSVVQRRRAVARNVANLIEGIEAGTVVADRNNVPIPTPAPSACPPSPAESAPPPVEACPPAPEPPPPPENAESAPAAAPRWSLGIRGAPVALLGLGAPSNVDRFSGVGGALTLLVRAPRSWVLGTDIRVATIEHVGLATRANRIRASVTGGYTWRLRQAAEIEALAGIGIEPWSVRRAGRRVDVADRTPLLGGWIRLSTGAYLELGALELRVGGWSALSLSGIPTKGMSVARIDFSGGDGLVPLFRLGGAEVSGGLEVVFRVSVQ